MPDSPAPRRARRPRPTRRTQRQQILLRRSLALAGVLVLAILIVLGVKGCLDARAERALSDYARDVSQIVDETQQTSKAFFGKLSDPGSLSVTEFIDQVNADRSAMDGYASRVDGLSAPGDMSEAQDALVLVYQLRASAMDTIATKMKTALGTVGAKKAVGAITRQMQKLLAADVVYGSVVRPDINGVLAEKGISGSDVPPSAFLPDGTKWLEEGSVSAAIGQVSGSSLESSTPGVHGLGLISTSVNGTELVEGVPAPIPGEETPEVKVQVQNQGDSTENGVTVSVSFEGHTVEQDINSIGAGETEATTIPLTPAPSGEVELEVEVETVPGERVSDNNKATYTVIFG